MRPITIRIDYDLYERYAKFADETGLTAPMLMISILARFYIKNSKQANNLTQGSLEVLKNRKAVVYGQAPASRPLKLNLGEPLYKFLADCAESTVSSKNLVINNILRMYVSEVR